MATVQPPEGWRKYPYNVDTGVGMTHAELVVYINKIGDRAYITEVSGDDRSAGGAS